MILSIIYDWHYLWMGFGFFMSAFLIVRVIDFNISFSKLISGYYHKNITMVRTLFTLSALTLIANSTIWGFLLLGWGVLYAFILDMICEFTIMIFVMYKTPDLFEQIKSLFVSTDESKMQ